MSSNKKKYTRETAETALCIWEWVLENRLHKASRNVTIETWLSKVGGTVSLRAHVLQLAAFMTLCERELEKSENTLDLWIAPFDWEIVPKVMARYTCGEFPVTLDKAKFQYAVAFTYATQYDSKTGKFKIQIPSLRGWADVKVSEDGGTYKDNHYDSAREAGEELDGMMQDLPDYVGRVVTADTEADEDLYDTDDAALL